jgi:hypothetical protein
MLIYLVLYNLNTYRNIWFTMNIKPEHLPEVIAGSLALYECTGGSLATHIPLPAFRNKLRPPYREKAKQIMEKRLKRYNFAYQKGGTESWP